MIRRNSVVTTFADETTTSISVSYAPATTIRGIWVQIITPTHGGDNISSVTFGGNALARVTEAHDSTGDSGSSYVYFDGTSLAAGTNNVVITVTGGSISLRGAIGSVIADGDTRIIASGSTQEDQWNPYLGLFAGLKPAIVVGGTFSGLADVSSLTELNGQTRIQSDDFGAHVSVSTVRTNPETFWFPIGWTASIDSVAFTAAAIIETEPTPPAFPGGGGGGFAANCSMPNCDLPTAVNTFTGTGASTLDNVTSAGTGVYTPPPITGTGASTLDDVTSAGTGALGVNGSGGSTLADVTSAGTGTYTPAAITGTGASTLEDVTSAGSGFLGVNGSGASTLGDVTSAGTGTYLSNSTGTGASTLDDVTSSGTGALGVNGAGASTLADITSAGVGEYTPAAITGTGSSTLGDVTSAGVGVFTAAGDIGGSGASTLDNITSSGTGIFTPPAPVAGEPVLKPPRFNFTRPHIPTRSRPSRVGGR